MTTLTTFKTKGYHKSFDIPTMIKAIEDKLIFNNLRMIQQDEFNRIKKQYNNKGFLAPNYISYLNNLYWNFVLNNFTFSKVNFKPQQEFKHIGMQMFNSLSNVY